MKNILFLIGSLTGGGAEKVLVDLVNNLDREKYNITVQTILDEGVHKDNLLPHIRYKTLNKIRNPFFRRLFSYLMKFPVVDKILYKFMIADNYDYEIAFLEGIPTKILSVSKNVTKYAWVHLDLYEFYDGHERVFPTLQENIDCYKKFDKIICVSEGVKDGFTKKFGDFENICVKYNILDDKNIKAKSNEIIDEIAITDKLRLVTVGRLVRQKGYDRLLEVHKKLINAGFSYELIIVGEGDDRQSLENYIKENNLSDSVKLPGFNKNPYKFIKKADLFVCSSRAEGFCLVIAEALILGTPVITTECSCLFELLGNNEFGVIVENSVDGLYNGLKNLLSNKEQISHYKKQAEIRSDYFKMQNSILSIEKLFGGG